MLWSDLFPSPRAKENMEQCFYIEIKMDSFQPSLSGGLLRIKSVKADL